MRGTRCSVIRSLLTSPQGWFRSPGVSENVFRCCDPLHDHLTHCTSSDVPSGDPQGQSGRGPRVLRGSETESADLAMFLVGLFGTRSKADLKSNDLVEGKLPRI